MNIRTLLPAAIVALVAVIGLSVYTVDERELAIRFRLGKIIETDLAPGVHFKVPFINNVLKFPRQILTPSWWPFPPRLQLWIRDLRRMPTE